MAYPVRTTRVLALAAAGALVLAGCGSDDDEDDTAAPQSTTASATTSASASAPAVNTGDGTLTVGTLLPQTGSLATLGPPEFAGVDLAIKEINAAGGVLGKPVASIKGDSGDTSTDTANPTVDRLLASKADVIVGAASSSVTKTVIDKITSAGVIQYSPANTAPEFTDYPDKGLYFRTAPSDILQGRVLGEKVVADGASKIAVLALQDAYGEGLSASVSKTVTEGGATLAPNAPVIYDPKATSFSAQAGQVKAANPDAIVLIGFDESPKVVQALIAQGIGPQDVPLYLVDGNLSNENFKDLPAGVLNKVQGSTPGAAAPTAFRAELLKVDPKLTDFTYSGEAYDAVITTALAATVAKSDAGKAMAAVLPDVTRGGTKCTTFVACKALAEAGTDLDYDGQSGPIEFSDKGDPTEASIGIYTYGPNNQYDPTKGEYQSGKIEG